MARGPKKQVELGLTTPSGPIKYKYSDFVHNDDFPEMGFVGPFATAKSTAAVDRLMRRGNEYPGSNALLARGTLTSLKDSTIEKLKQRAGVAIISSNDQEAIFRLPPQACPIRGSAVMLTSTINGIGLDRIDLEKVMKSTEYFTVHLEEANEIPSDAHDLVQERARQEVYHRSLTVMDLCMTLAARWSRFSARTITPEDVYHILLGDPRNRVGEKQLARDHPMPGETSISATWNPVGNDHTWARYVGVAYPMPAPTEDWVRKNVGIREVHIEAPELRSDRFEFRAGSLVKLPDGSRSYAARHDQRNGIVHLADGRELPDKQAGLILQRYCIYAFAWENESRDYKNVENTYLMVNKGMRQRHQHGYVDVREGRVFAPYVNEPVSQGGHVLPAVTKDRIRSSGSMIVGGLDGGLNHATALVFAMYLPSTQSIVIFDEYVKSQQSAHANAIEVQQRMVPGLQYVIGHDPAMGARPGLEDTTTRYIDPWKAVLGDILFPAVRGDEMFDEVMSMLEYRDNFIGHGPMPRLMVTENCVQTRKVLFELTWDMVKRRRHLWMVDLGDAVKYLVSMVKKGYVDMGKVDIDMTPRMPYSNQFKERGRHGYR